MSKDVSPEQWGRAALEEALFRAASKLGPTGAKAVDVIEVAVPIQVSAGADGTLRLVIVSDTEGPISTALRPPF